MFQTYAQAMGIAIIVLGVVGFLAGEQHLLGLINIDAMEDAVHLLTGGIMAFVGFTQRNTVVVRNVIGGVGVLYLLVGLLGWMSPTLLGLLPHGYTAVDNLVHMILGAVGMILGWAYGGRSVASAARGSVR
jgi:hypothetical protein